MIPGVCYRCSVEIVCIMYGTKHIKLNVLRMYLFCENTRETDTGGYSLVCTIP